MTSHPGGQKITVTSKEHTQMSYPYLTQQNTLLGHTFDHIVHSFNLIELRMIIILSSEGIQILKAKQGFYLVLQF